MVYLIEDAHKTISEASAEIYVVQNVERDPSWSDAKFAEERTKHAAAMQLEKTAFENKKNDDLTKNKDSIIRDLDAKKQMAFKADPNFHATQLPAFKIDFRNIVQRGILALLKTRSGTFDGNNLVAPYVPLRRMAELSNAKGVGVKVAVGVAAVYTRVHSAKSNYEYSCSLVAGEELHESSKNIRRCMDDAEKQIIKEFNKHNAADQPLADKFLACLEETTDEYYKRICDIDMCDEAIGKIIGASLDTIHAAVLRSYQRNERKVRESINKIFPTYNNVSFYGIFKRVTVVTLLLFIILLCSFSDCRRW